MSSVFAYFDPGSGSLLLQALVGGSAGLIVFGKLLWESARGWLLGSSLEHHESSAVAERV